MQSPEALVDIHCHLLSGIDDGAASRDQSIAMARMAVADGITTIVATPHQLGTFSANDAATIRRLVVELQDTLDREEVALRVLPGADVRIEPDLAQLLAGGDVLSLADSRYVLLELPHEIYFPLDRLLEELAAVGHVGILSHPERNEGILADPAVLPGLVSRGCLLQVTAGSLLGAFGRRAQRLAEDLVVRRLAHFVSTDAHGTRHRPPLLAAAFARIGELAGPQTAVELCCRNPAAMVANRNIAAFEPRSGMRRPAPWTNWFAGKRTAS